LGSRQNGETLGYFFFFEALAATLALSFLRIM